MKVSFEGLVTSLQATPCVAYPLALLSIPVFCVLGAAVLLLGLVTHGIMACLQSRQVMSLWGP